MSGSSAGRIDQAYGFVSTANCELTELDIALTSLSGIDGAVVSLRTDNGGVPDAVLTAWVVGSLPPFEGCCTVDALVPNDPVTLLGDQKYWVVVTANGIGDQLTWNFNSAGEAGLHATTTNGVVFTTDTSLQGAFQVLGDVPEPSSSVLVVLGLALIARRLK